VVLGLVMLLRGGEDTYAYVYTAAHDALRRLGACWSDDAARRAVERAVAATERSRIASAGFACWHAICAEIGVILAADRDD